MNTGTLLRPSTSGVRTASATSRKSATPCEEELEKGRVKAQVYGRPKHIYSIYKKMQRKHLAFEEVFDVRAVRIVVDSVPECYAALGIVHGLWTYIPGEFDDYIATPKGNFYRSIHTAVIGPHKRSVEIQIRTNEMHEHAELGVAAHWQYKEGGARDAQYERKIEWVRRLLEPEAAAADTDKDFLERMRTELFEDRVARSRRRAKWSTCLAARPRWILPTTCTRTSAIAAGEPRSTAASSRSTTRCRTVRSSRSSPASTPLLAATGWHLSRDISSPRATGRRCVRGSASSTSPTTAALAARSPSASSRAGREA